MKIYSDISLENFEFWSGAVDTAERITEEGKWDSLEAILEDLYPDGITDTQLNDLLWFEPNTVYEWLGISDNEEEDFKTEEDCEDFDDFCSQFPLCSGCPYSGEIDDCEEHFNEVKDGKNAI